MFWRHKRPRISKSTLRKEIGAGGIKLPGYITKLQSSKQYSTGKTNKQTNKQTNKNRNTAQWKRIESPELNPWTYGQLIDGKGGKSMQWKKDSPFIK